MQGHENIRVYLVYWHEAKPHPVHVVVFEKIDPFNSQGRILTNFKLREIDGVLSFVRSPNIELFNFGNWIIERPFDNFPQSIYTLSFYEIRDSDWIGPFEYSFEGSTSVGYRTQRQQPSTYLVGKPDMITIKQLSEKLFSSLQLGKKEKKKAFIV